MFVCHVLLCGEHIIFGENGRGSAMARVRKKPPINCACMCECLKLPQFFNDILN